MSQFNGRNVGAKAAVSFGTDSIGKALKRANINVAGGIPPFHFEMFLIPSCRVVLGRQ